MKIKATLLALLMGFTLSASAQIYTEDYIFDSSSTITVGPKAEMIYGVMAGAIIPVMSDKEDIVEFSNTVGYQVGMMWGVDLGGLEIIPEIWYQHNKANVDHTKYGEEGELITNGIEVPILFGMQFAKWGKFIVGPSLSLMSDTKYKSDDDDDYIDFGRTKSTCGYVVGLSFNILENIILDARYSGRFVSMETDWHTGSSEHNYRYYNYSFNIGYRF